MVKKVFLVSLLLVLFFSNLVLAIGRGPGARAAAMGGAYSALASGIEAIAWNPAGMARGSALSSMLSAGGDSTISYQDAKNLFDKLKTQKGREDYVIENILKEIKIIGNAQVPLGISLGNFGVAAMGTGFLLANKAELNFDFILLGAYELDYGLIYGDSLGRIYDPLKDLFWGLTVRGFSGEGRFLYYTPNVYFTEDQITTLALEGGSVISNGMAGDVGLEYKFGDGFILALALKDISSSYDQKVNANYRAVDFNKRTLGNIVATVESRTRETGKSRWTLGLAYKLKEWGLLISSDVDHYFTTAILPSDPQFGKEIEATDLHLGLEKEVFDWLFLRAGASSDNLCGIPETWLTYGLGTKLQGVRIDLAAGNSSKQTWQVYLELGLAF